MKACLPNCLLLWSVFLISTASAQQLPRFDVEATCRAAPRLLAADANPYEGCMQDERDAERQLQGMWRGAAAAHRETCAGEAQIGGSPSYVDMLTCLQMAQGTTPTAEPRRQRAPH
jgi:hypothetical protein